MPRRDALFGPVARGLVARGHELDQDRRQAHPQRVADVAGGQRQHQLAQPQQLEQHVGVKTLELPARPARHVGALALPGPLAGLFGDPGRLGDQPVPIRLAEQLRARARDRDPQRAGVDADAATPEPHRLDQHRAAAAERIDDGVARNAERGRCRRGRSTGASGRRSCETRGSAPGPAPGRRRRYAPASRPPTPRPPARRGRPASRTPGAAAEPAAASAVPWASRRACRC